MDIGPTQTLLILETIVVGIWPAWRLCGRVGWSRWLILLLFVPIAGLIFLLMLAWKTLPMAGYGRLFVLLLLVPIINVLMLFWLAFSQWDPELRAAPRGEAS